MRRAVSAVALRAAVAAFREILAQLEARRGAPPAEPTVGPTRATVRDLTGDPGGLRTTVIPNAPDAPSQGALDDQE